MKTIIKIFLNLVLTLEKKNSILFRFMMACNELYIRLYFFCFRSARLLRKYDKLFFSNKKKFLLKALDVCDNIKLFHFFQEEIDLKSNVFFIPHKIDLNTISSILKKKSYLPLGVYSFDNEFIGYALVRLLFPKKASYSIFMANKWQGKGIGTAALIEELDLISSLGFSPFSSVNKKNEKSLRMLKRIGIEFDEDLGECLVVKGKG